MEAAPLTMVKKIMEQQGKDISEIRSECDICNRRAASYAIPGTEMEKVCLRGFNPIKLGLNTAPREHGVDEDLVYATWLARLERKYFSRAWIACNECYAAVDEFMTNTDEM